jgi:hypothetical protein
VSPLCKSDSWLPSEPPIVSILSDAAIVRVPLDAEDLVNFLVSRETDVYTFPATTRSNLSRENFELLSGKFALHLLGWAAGELLSRQSRIEEIVEQRIFLAGAYYLPGDAALALIVKLDAPADPNWPGSEGVRMIQEAKLRLAEVPSGVPCQEEQTVAELLRGADFSKTFPLFPIAIYVALLPSGEKEQLARIEEKISKSTLRRPRDGRYMITLAVADNGRQSCLITGDMAGEKPGYPELQASLARTLPSAFDSPRSSGAHVPTINPPFEDEAEIWCPDLGVLGSDLASELPRLHDLVRLSGDSDQQDRARKAIECNGFDAFGWYQGYHLYDDHSWGIYLHGRRIQDMAGALYQDLRWSNSYPLLAVLLAVGLVYHHELFHARVEAALTWVETIRRNPRYRAYKINVYRVQQGTEDWLEEALANWAAVDWLRNRLPVWTDAGLVSDWKKVEIVVQDWLACSPPGYRDWIKGDEPACWRTLGSELATGRPRGLVRGIPLPVESLLRGPPPFDFRASDVPTRMYGGLGLSDTFYQPPSVRDAEKLLRHFNYQCDTRGGKGSHEVWTKDGRKFTLPRRDPISQTVFKTLLKHLEIERNYYFSELRGKF